MTATNYLNQGINAAVRIAFVVVPTMKAGTHLVELASRAINAGLKVINIEVKMPELIDETKPAPVEGHSYASQFYSKIHSYLPKTITIQNEAFKGLTNRDLITGTVLYTSIAIAATFVANKFIGPMPETYNTVAKYAGSALRLDTKYDVIQMAINYFNK